MSNVWKMIQEKKEIAKHMPKNHKHILVPSQRYQYFRHLLQNPTVPNYVMGFSNRAHRFTRSNYLDVDSPLRYPKKSIKRLNYFLGISFFFHFEKTYGTPKINKNLKRTKILSTESQMEQENRWYRARDMLLQSNNLPTRKCFGS